MAFITILFVVLTVLFVAFCLMLLYFFGVADLTRNQRERDRQEKQRAMRLSRIRERDNIVDARP